MISTGLKLRWPDSSSALLPLLASVSLFLLPEVTKLPITGLPCDLWPSLRHPGCAVTRNVAASYNNYHIVVEVAFDAGLHRGILRRTLCLITTRAVFSCNCLIIVSLSHSRLVRNTYTFQMIESDGVYTTMPSRPTSADQLTVALPVPITRRARECQAMCGRCRVGDVMGGGGG